MQSEVRFLFDDSLILGSGERLTPFPVPESECVQYCRRMPADTDSSVHYEVNTIRKGDAIQGYRVVLHTEYETADGDAEARKSLIRNLRWALTEKGISESNFIMGKSWSWLDLHCKELIPPGLGKEEFILKVTRLMTELYGLTEGFLKEAEHNPELNPYGWDDEEEATDQQVEVFELNDIKTGEPECDAELWNPGTHATSASVARVLKMKLRIPNYQRPYKWERRNVIELLRDIEEAIANRDGGGARHYRLGTILLHDNNGVFEIVDGQQRLLTLSLLLFFLKSAPAQFSVPLLNDDNTLKQLSRQPETRKRLSDNFVAIQDYFGNRTDLKQTFFTALCGFLQVVIIKVEHLADAFQLFDSQNTRGRALDAHDLLKAYHLRAMQMAGDSERKMNRRVQGWEAVNPALIRSLFDAYLFRIYNWSKGQRTHVFSAKDIAAFKGLAPNRQGKMFPFVRRAVATEHEFQIGADFQAGECFFSFVEHYLDLRDDINSLLDGVTCADQEMKKMLRIVTRVMHCPGVSGGFRYLHDLFRCVLFCYADRFGMENLDARILAKLCMWTYAVMLDKSRMSEKTVNRYAIGASGYTNEKAMFTFIQEALQPAEIVGLSLGMANVSNPLHRRLKKLETPK